ncbi:MAG: hypothetical protein R2745_22255 [Vicinamibacterales bacterium]
MRASAVTLLLATAGLVLMAGRDPVAQVDPRSLPLLDPAVFDELTEASFTYDWHDGAGGDISYGGGALGVSEDGNFLYISCARDDSGIAKLEIPADGERAPVVAPCRGPVRTTMSVIHPDPTAFRPMLGGVLEQDGRICVSAYISYDADGGARLSHWCGRSLTSLDGPFAGTVSPGLVGGPMVPVPKEWREALGGPALTSLYLRSIVSRSSFGFTASVFDPATATRSPIDMQMLVGCPNSEEACHTYGSPTSNDYNGSELSGGYFIAPGTRTLVAIERESSGPTCYGYATRFQTLQGQPYKDAVYCYSLSDPLDIKGPKGYPYRLVAKLYDLNDLAAVHAGEKAPWDFRQYATIDMPASSPSEFVTSGAFNPIRGEHYLLRNVGGGENTVYIYRGFPTVTP